MPNKTTTKPSALPLPARPFLKWVGGKGRLLNQYKPFFPKQFNNYFEPFIGGGAVYFLLNNQFELSSRASLCDRNTELINAYRIVRDNPQALLHLLQQHQAHHNNDYFYQVRNRDRQPSPTDPVEQASRTIYLNKTCYNGLYRVNKKGFFNVPVGRYKNPAIFVPQIIQAASRALQGATIEQRDFREILKYAQKGDFIYFDPPYVPLSVTANFTSYTSDNFSLTDQRELAQVFQSLNQRGCQVMLSNSFTPEVQELYRGFRQEKITARRAVNSKTSGRGELFELLILNY